jgi:peptide/nickel transport system permease protein
LPEFGVGDAPERPAASVVAGAGGGPATLGALEGAPPPLDDTSAEALGIEEVRLSQWQLSWRRFRRHKLAMASLIILALLTLAVVLAPLIAPYGYAKQHLTDILKGPRAKYPLGTDTLGRDQLSRILYGGRVSLAVGAGVALISGVVGTFVGAVSGYFGGRLDTLLMRVTDLFLSVPLLVLLIIGAKLFGGSVLDIVVILSLFFWMPLARIVRGTFLSLKQKEFVEAARAVGAPGRRIILRHLLPNSMGPIIVNVTLSVAVAILTESVLSFLGFGVKPPTPTWGNMLFDSKNVTTVAPWTVFFPGLMIFITVVAVNFLGDGMRDALDPTQRRVRT